MELLAHKSESFFFTTGEPSKGWCGGWKGFAFKVRSARNSSQACWREGEKEAEQAYVVRDKDENPGKDLNLRPLGYEPD